MSYDISLLPSAFEDLKVAKKFYEEVESGLGDYCIDNLLTDIESLRFYAGIHPVVLNQYRLLAHRFPYAIYYKLENQNVTITAVLSTRVNPVHHHKRLRT